MNAERLLAHYRRIADAPDAIASLRRFVLDLAVHGKLMPQDPKDEPAAQVLERIDRASKRTMRMRTTDDGEGDASSEIEPLFELPIGWEWTRFGRLPLQASVGIDRGRSKQGPDKAFAYFKMNNIRNEGGTDFSNLIRIDATLDEVEAFVLSDGDFLFNTRNSRELVGKTCVFRPPSDQPVLYNNNILRVKFVDGFSPEFIDYWFRSLEGKTALEKLKSNTTNVCAIYQGKLWGFPCPVPPLAEQHRIVAKVNELMALCDKLKAARAEREATRDRLTAASLARLNSPDPETFQDDARFTLDALPVLTTRPDQIKQLRQTILNLAVRGALTSEINLAQTDAPSSDAVAEAHKPYRISQSWRWVRMDEIVQFAGGSQPPKSTFIYKPKEGYTRLVQIRDFKSDNYMTFVPSEKANRPFKENDVMIGRYGPPVFQILRGLSGTYNVALMKAEPKISDLLNEFLFFLLQESRIHDEVVKESERTAGQTGVRLPLLNSFVVGLPPVSEQRRIVAKVDELMALCDRLEASLATIGDTRRRLLDALLAEALAPGGVLVPQKPERVAAHG
jgi:type I restriction enzyme S subunit